jgi:hypothetical protein
MYDAFVNFVDYLRSLNWSAEQLQFLALMVGGFIALYLMLRLVTYPFRARARRRETAERKLVLDRLNAAEATVAGFKENVTRLGIEEVGVHEALKVIAANRTTALTETVDAPLLAGFDQAILQRLDIWVKDKGAFVLDGQLARLVGERLQRMPENTRNNLMDAIDRRTAKLFDSWLDKNSDDVSESAQETFRELMKERFGALPSETRKPLNERFDRELSELIGQWLDEGNNDTLNEQVGEAFSAMLKERFENLPDELRKRLFPRIDKAMEDLVDTWIAEGDGTLHDSAVNAFNALVQERGATLPAERREAIFAKIDDSMVELIEGWAEDTDDDDMRSAATAAFQKLAATRADTMSEETRKEILGKVDEGIKAVIDGWIENGADDEDLKKAAEAVFTALLAGYEKTLDEETRTEIFEKFDEKLVEMIGSWLEDPSEDEDFSDAGRRALKALLEERLKQLPDGVKARIHRKIDDAFKSEAENILDNLEDHDDVTETMRKRLKEVAAGRLQ